MDEDLTDELEFLRLEVSWWKNTVAKCHQLLTKAGIPEAQRQPCNDPNCDGLLYHRINGVLKELAALREDDYQGQFYQDE